MPLPLEVWHPGVFLPHDLSRYTNMLQLYYSVHTRKRNVGRPPLLSLGSERCGCSGEDMISLANSQPANLLWGWGSNAQAKDSTVISLLVPNFGTITNYYWILMFLHVIHNFTVGSLNCTFPWWNDVFVQHIMGTLHYECLCSGTAGKKGITQGTQLDCNSHPLVLMGLEREMFLGELCPTVS